MAFASGTNPFGCSSAIRAFSSCSISHRRRCGAVFHLRDVLRLSHSIGNYPNKTFEQVYDDYLTKLKTEGTFYLERDLPDGRTVAVYNRPKKNGCWVVTYEDVTERKAFVDRLREREAELETKNRLFDAAINNMAHGLSMFDRDER